MGFIRKSIRNAMVYFLNYDNNLECVKAPDSLIRENDLALEADHEKTMRFNIISADGGRIVEIRSYDKKTDRMKQNLYIIDNNDDIAMELSHIITKESLMR